MRTFLLWLGTALSALVFVVLAAVDGARRVRKRRLAAALRARDVRQADALAEEILSARRQR